MSRFSKFAWFTLLLSVAVIAGGAVVRATGSGAGCGSHWPTCQGAVVPLSGTSATVIEFAHRGTSGLAFGAVVLLALAARRRFPRGDRVRRSTGAAVWFMIGEVAIGAALVTYEWVGENASVARALVGALHLVNTLFLLAALALAAWWSTVGGGPRSRPRPELLAGLVALIVVAAAGAMTALGDTLFPEAGVADDFSGGAHFLVRMRIIHPLVAVITGVYVVLVARRFLSEERRVVSDLSRVVVALIGAQLLAGVVNLALSAPLAMQVIHLVLADGVWVALVLLTAAEAMSEAPVRVAS